MGKYPVMDVVIVDLWHLHPQAKSGTEESTAGAPDCPARHVNMDGDIHCVPTARLRGKAREAVPFAGGKSMPVWWHAKS